MVKNTNLNILLLGPGNVGKTFLRQFTENRSQIEKRYSINVKVIGIIGRNKYSFDLKGIDLRKTQQISSSKNNVDSSDKSVLETQKLVNKCPRPFVVIDTTASDKTYPILINALRTDGFVILANKKPLSSDLQKFNGLFKFNKRLFFETTVGAGLPVISTLTELLETGDEIISIRGCFSGTLGFIFTLLKSGATFSDAIREARKQGLTEPDPRDDLSGLDVARKVLILNRIIGKNLSLTDVKLQCLYPQQMTKLTPEEFIENIHAADNKYNELINNAQKKNRSLKYVAEIDKENCRIGIKEFDNSSDIGSLAGTANIIIIKTKRYNKNPLVIKGPGAGLEVTAAGIMGDLIKIVKTLSI